MTFTSDVSLPKDDKKAMQGKQITAMLTMLQKKGRGSKAWAVRQGR